MPPTRPPLVKNLVPTIIVATTLLCFFSQTSALAADKKSNLKQDVTVMEKCIFGQAKPDKPLPVRIKALEQQVNGSSGKNGTFNQRVLALKKKIGQSSAASSLPPVAPAFGKEQQSPAINGSQISGDKNLPVNPEKTAADLKEAIKLHTSGKTNDAEALFKKVLTSSPYNADACFSLGTIAEGRGDLTAALGYYSTAALANPLDTDAQNAVREIQEKIALKQTAPFSNPLSADSGNILRARAIDINNVTPSNYYGQQEPSYAPTRRVLPARAVSSNQGAIPTVGIKQKNPSSGMSPIARTVARTAFSAVLSGTGLHCPLCNLLKGF